MCVLPFYYVYGLSLLHTHMAVGTAVVIDNGSFPNVVLNAMQQHHVTGFAGVPSTFALLLRRSALDDLELPSLRYVTQAAAACRRRESSSGCSVARRCPLRDVRRHRELRPPDLSRPARLTERIGSIGKRFS
jgi:acyl-CoA synthetase (AMP-forming)/AMP-acid ligase II